MKRRKKKVQNSVCRGDSNILCLAAGMLAITYSVQEEQRHRNSNGSVGSGEVQCLIHTLVVILAAVVVSSVISSAMPVVVAVTFSSDSSEDIISTEVSVTWFLLLLVHFQTCFFSLCIGSLRFLALFCYQSNSSRTLTKTYGSTI